MGTPSKRKRTELCLEDKVKLIKDSPGKSQRQLAEQYGIGKTQVQSILKRKAEILDGYHIEMSPKSRKRICKRSPVEELNSLVWEWFKKMMAQGIRLSGPKALLFAKRLDIPETEFRASKGWLNRFRERHSILFQTICGESGSVNEGTVKELHEKLKDIIRDYQPQDVYNMDETGLYYRAMPDKTLCISGRVQGGKKMKDRLTVMLCVNMTGDFEKPFVIGKAEKPRCFRNLKVENLPVTWNWNKKAWMTSSLFVKWVKDFDKMRHQNRHVLLFLDNASSHPNDLNLTNVELVFLPKNTTSVLQPLDQGIIQNMKVIYRKRLIRFVLAKIDNGSEMSADGLSKSVSVLSAVRFVKSAVSGIKKENVTKCFRKAGFLFDGVEPEEEDDGNIPILELVEIMKKSLVQLPIAEPMTAEDFVAIDSNEDVHEDLPDDWEEMVNRVKNVETEDVIVLSESDSEESNSDTESDIKTNGEAMKQIENMYWIWIVTDL